MDVTHSPLAVDFARAPTFFLLRLLRHCEDCIGKKEIGGGIKVGKKRSRRGSFCTVLLQYYGTFLLLAKESQSPEQTERVNYLGAPRLLLRSGSNV